MSSWYTFKAYCWPWFLIWIRTITGFVFDVYLLMIHFYSCFFGFQRFPYKLIWGEKVRIHGTKYMQILCYCLVSLFMKHWKVQFVVQYCLISKVQKLPCTSILYANYREWFTSTTAHNEFFIFFRNIHNELVDNCHV